MKLKLEPDLENVKRSYAGPVWLNYPSASDEVLVSQYLETRPAMAPAATVCSRDPWSISGASGRNVLCTSSLRLSPPPDIQLCQVLNSIVLARCRTGIIKNLGTQ